MEYEVTLTAIKDKRSLFCFAKIENLMSKFENKIKIHQDAYFRILHLESKYFIGIDEKEIEMTYIDP